MRGIRWAVSGIALLLPASVCAAPSVALTAPVAEARYLAPAAIELTADPVVDAGRSIERVEFLADGAVIGVATQAPYTFSWTNVAKGNYNLRARVFDNLGARDASPVVRIHVRDNTPPKIRISAPEHRFIAPGSVPLTAEVTDRDDPIAKVEFFNGETLLATLTAEPYALSWTDVPAGNYDIRATATDSLGATGTSNLFRVRVRDNTAPHVRILTPDNRDTFSAPAAISITLHANDRDDNLTNVQLFANGAPLSTFTAAPYEFNWTGIQPGTYALTARATDDLGLVTTSRTVNVTITGAPPTAEPKLYFIHVDHLNTPRLVADEQQRTVWRWDQQEPFGDSLPDGNPSGVGAFEFPLRSQGTYLDRETGLLQNWHRDVDVSRGQYLESDPIGLKGGLNTYAHLLGNPLSHADPDGLAVLFLCRPVSGLPIYSHCFVRVTCRQEGWDFTLSLYGTAPYINSIGYRRIARSDDPTSSDNPNTSGVNYKQQIFPRLPIGAMNTCQQPCLFEKAVMDEFDRQPMTMPYGGFTNNSNTFAQNLITSGVYGTALPSNAPTNAPGFVSIGAGRINQ